MRRRPGFWVFLLALSIRLVYLAGIRDLPWFEVPIVDGANYARLAQSIARGGLLGGGEAFWQPPLYSYFLAVPFALFGTAMLPVYIMQAILGALSCALASAIGERLYGGGAGLAAGLIMALYGPLIHFDAQPLIPVLHIALILGGLLIMVRAGCDPMTLAGPGDAPRADGGMRWAGGGARWAGAGALWGLAAVATPNILLAAPAAAGWAWRRAGRAATALLVAGAAVPVALVAARNLAVAGEPVLISSNGGINFYIGNNPDYDRTVRARPGGDFERIAQEPGNAGISGAAARSRWFAARGARFLLDYPGDALRLYARKALDLVAGREIPRNENMYDYRATSLVLRLLLWRAGIGFPFGVLAPLALAGVLVGLGRAVPGSAPGRDGRAGTALLLMIAGAYALSVLLFFPTDRYRLPLVPLAAILAGRMLAAGAAVWRRPAILAGLLCGLVLFNLDAAKAQESWPEEAALNRAYALRALGRPAEAKEAYREAAALNPRRLDPPNALAAMAAAEGDWPEAEARYRDLVSLAPDFVEARTMLGRALAAQGRTAEAREQWVIASHLAPGAGLALAELSLSWLAEGVLATAFDYGEQAVRARPDVPETHYAWAMTARALRRRDVALREFTEAARLFPDGSDGRRRAEEILTRMRQAAGG